MNRKLTIKPEIRARVLEMSKEGKGRNQIVYELDLEHVKVSSGSVSNILNEYKNNKSQITDLRSPQVNTNTYTRTSLDIVGSPSSAAQARDGDGLANVEKSESVDVRIFEPDIDFADISYQESYPNPADVNTIQSIKMPEETSREESEQCNLDSDWDEDRGVWERKLLREIVESKKQRHNEILQLERQRQRLEVKQQLFKQARDELDLQKQDLEVQRNKMIQDEALIPFAKSLKQIGATSEILLPFISLIRNRALAENIDTKKIAEKLTQELENYRQLGILQRNVESAKQQPASLNDLKTEKQHAIMTLLNLKNEGYSERDVKELLKHVNNGRRTASDIWVDN